MTHRTPSDAYRSIRLLDAAGCRCKLVADKLGWHVSVMRNKKEFKK